MLGRGACLMPGIPMNLVAQDGSMLPQIYGLVDSGADCSMFPSQWAAALGIDLQQDCLGQTGETAGGESDQHVYVQGVDAIIMGRKLHLEAVFCEGLKVALLGRSDFFQEYKVFFDQRSMTFRVESY